MAIPLRDIPSVDEEVPSRRSGGGSHANGGAGGLNFCQCGPGVSDFYSNAASDAGVARETGEARGTGLPPALPPLPTGSSRGRPYRLFLRSLSHDYVEFGLDHSNSYDICTAYLQAHLPTKRLPRWRPPGATAPGRGGLHTVVLIPGREPPAALGGAARAAAARSVARPPLPLTRSNSTLPCNNTDKLHSQAIHQRLRNEATPLQRLKDHLAGWVSTVIDCACC